MHTKTRYVMLTLTLLVSLHFIVSFTYESYGHATSISNIVSKFRSPSGDQKLPDKSPQGGDGEIVSIPRANATLFMLCRNSDLDGAVRSIRSIEDRFNRKYRYPYVLLNEEPFTDEFKERITVLIHSQVEFGLIPREHWFQPDWVDEEKATTGRNAMEAKGIIYAGSVPYRNMCRFNSGFFFRHPLVQKYRWYWRIEPDVQFHCDIHYDPFVFMETHNKTYSFTITLYEFEATIPTLWGHVMDFARKYPEYISRDNALGFMSEDKGATYNLCHFWSNFEIADMDFWRGEAYTKFFEYLDNLGGFYYERWGDAPVHSMAAALFRSKDQIHFFHDIGYEHSPFNHCPMDGETWRNGKCSCGRSQSFDYHGYSCMRKWDHLMDQR